MASPVDEVGAAVPVGHEGVPVLVVECRGRPEVLDEARIPGELSWVRLRPDRALVVALEVDDEHRARVLQAIEADHPHVVVVDVSPGWVGRELGGEATARLAGLAAMWPEPPGRRARAGMIAGVPAIVVPTGSGVVVVVGASRAHHFWATLGAEPDRVAMVEVVT